jgi:hypothetical protein
MPKSKKNSPKKLSVPGNPILAILKKKKKKEYIGINETRPYNIFKWRVPYLSYKQPIKKNNPLEIRP